MGRIGLLRGKGMYCAMLALALSAAPAAAQQPQPPAANPADVNSVDAIITAIYAVISGPAGQERNWDRFRSLFLSGARLIATGRTPQGEGRYRVMTPDEYQQLNGPALVSGGFNEVEIARRTESFGNITHAFSTYEGKFNQQGQMVTQRGINSIQLFNDGKRWWVVTIFWDSERPDNPIPAKYLSGGN